MCKLGSELCEVVCVEQILGLFVRCVFRWPIIDVDIMLLMVFYNVGCVNGSFEFGIEFVLCAILVDFEFLFCVEVDFVVVVLGKFYEISDFEFVFWLLFFFWSSVLDDELLGLVECNELRDDGVFAV